MNGGKWETDGRESFSFLKSHINNINNEVFSSSSFRWAKKLDLNLWEIRINGATYVCVWSTCGDFVCEALEASEGQERNIQKVFLKKVL